MDATRGKPWSAFLDTAQLEAEMTRVAAINDAFFYASVCATSIAPSPSPTFHWPVLDVSRPVPILGIVCDARDSQINAARELPVLVLQDIVLEKLRARRKERGV